MQRRDYLGLVTGSALTVLAGCTDDSEDGNGNGGGNGNENGDNDENGDDERTEEKIVDERVFGEAQYNFDAEAGQQVRVVVDNEEGSFALIDIYGFDLEEGEDPGDENPGADVIRESVQTDAEYSAELEWTGVYQLLVSGDRVAVELYLK